jgi:Zn-dependent M28 family amino/carboxypeptidase
MSDASPGAGQPESAAIEAAAIEAAAIDAHLRFLAHPLLEGRAPGTRGGTLAAEYVRAQFRRIGLHPLGDTYFQRVPMIGLTADPDPSLAIAAAAAPPRALAFRDDFTLRAGVPQAEVEVDAELVFVGFGITAPEYEWDDFAGVDVRGKVLLIRVNDPGSEETPGFFGGRALTYYGRWTYKYEEAARRGAAGAILIHTTDSAGYGWNVVRTSNSDEQFDLAGEPEFPLQVRGWIQERAIREVLRGGGLELDELYARSQERGFRPVPTGLTVRARVRSHIREVETMNVAGLLRGGDTPRADEVVVLCSHYDHLGVGRADDGTPQVYHGAYDNASGVAALIAAAEAAARLPRPPARSLLFLATTAEESGLLGAEWYTRHPLVPLARTAAVLNLDGLNLQGRTHDLAPLGTAHSELGEWAGQAASALGLGLSPEPHPEQGMFFRQDHFPFVRAGVPALALDHGLRFEGRPEGWGQQWYEEFVSRHYHQPSDAYREGIDYGGAVQQAGVWLRLALAAAEAARFPQWSPSSEFANSRDGMTV